MGASTMASLQLVLLGGFQARAAGQEIDVPGRKERALLAFLAIPAGESRSRDKLAGLLWSDRGDSQARDSLKQAVFKLRKSLDGVQPLPLLADRDCVRLERAAVAVDVAEFEQLIGEGSMESLTRATALYRGDFLDGLDLRDAAFDEWLLMERQRLRELAREALARLVDWHMASGAHDQAAAAARRLLAIDPLREVAHRALMQIYAAQGQTALALKQYQLCRDALQSELGVKPEVDTERLHRAIQEKRATASRTPERLAAATAIRETSASRDPSSLAEHGESAAPSTRPAIAVLPFANLSADPDQEYFSNGISEDIITELSRYRSLLVIARNSSFQFRGPSVDIAAVRAKLGVRFVVEGSIRKAGTRLRLTAQLIDAMTESQVWAERYDREVGDVFAVQDDLTRAIVATIEGRVAASGAEQSRRRPTKDWVAYDYFLQGWDRFSRYQYAEAEPFFARAVELDPGYAHAYALRAKVMLGKYWRDLQTSTIEQALDCARKALALDDTDAWSHMAMGFVLTHRGQRDLGGPYFDRAIALNPTDVMIAYTRAWWLARVGRAEEALECLDLAMHRDPFPPAWFWEVRAIALLVTRRYEDVIESLGRMPFLHAWDHAYLAACHAYLNRTAEAHAAASEVLRLDPDFTVSRYARIEGYTLPTELEHLCKGMRNAGLPE
jgi:TolB-like protein/Tfp pilus assembly protein PilF